MSGRNWEHEAGILWPILVEAAEARTTLIYQDLATVINTNPLSTGHALDPIYLYCRDTGIAPLSAIVVSKTTGRPGQGFIDGWGENFQAAFEQVYEFDWSTVVNPFAGYGFEDSTDSLADSLLTGFDAPERVYRKVEDRGQLQQIFRAALLKAYQARCAFCGCSIRQILEAAHILPWSRARNGQRADPRNGLLLCANHHKLFDAGNLTINEDFRIRMSEDMSQFAHQNGADKNIAGHLRHRRIHLPMQEDHWPGVEFIRDHHRVHGFAG